MAVRKMLNQMTHVLSTCSTVHTSTYYCLFHRRNHFLVHLRNQETMYKRGHLKQQIMIRLMQPLEEFFLFGSRKSQCYYKNKDLIADHCDSVFIDDRYNVLK